VRRCTGHCCRELVLPVPPCVLAMMAATAERTLDDLDQPWRSPFPARLVGHYRVPHALTEGRFTWARARDVVTLAAGMKLVRHDERPFAIRHVYRCTHLNEAGDCSIYDDRPNLCRDYPHGEPCQHLGCTLAGEPA